MLGTIDAVRADLERDGLLLRYRTQWKSFVARIWTSTDVAACAGSAATGS